MNSDQWDVIRVPFPFADKAAARKRPALVLSTRAFNAHSEHTVMTMITKRENSSRPNDYEIKDWIQAGLKIPSWIRLKVFTLENGLIIDKLGVLQPGDVDEFLKTTRPALW